MYFDLPLHPQMVHLSLGLTIVMPLVALGVAVAIRLEWLKPAAWFVVVVLQMIIFTSCLASLSTGEAEAAVVVKLTGGDPILAHQTVAQAYTGAAGLTLVISLLGVLTRKRSVAATFKVLTILATVVVLLLAIRTGHRGGLLVYRFHAPDAYTTGRMSTGADSGGVVDGTTMGGE